MMAESGIWISPTLQAWTGYPAIVRLTAQRDAGTISPEGEADLERLEERAEGRLDVMRRMLDYGMRDRIVPGTDSGVGDLAFGHIDYDLQLLVRVGFTPAEALALCDKYFRRGYRHGGRDWGYCAGQGCRPCSFRWRSNGRCIGFQSCCGGVSRWSKGSLIQ